MSQTNKYRSVSVSEETMDLLKTIKSCYQLATRETVTYDELISQLVTAGLKQNYPRVYAMLSLVSAEQKAEIEGNELLVQESAEEAAPQAQEEPEGDDLP